MVYSNFSLIDIFVMFTYLHYIILKILLKSHRAENPKLLDEILNRKAVLLMMIAVVLSCSPVCEKQALFALCKSVEENGLEPHLIKKVHMDEYFVL